jgi:uncharacterized membrane protein YbhN (UPF0104 family)
MSRLRKETVETAELVNIWMFLICIIVAVMCMMPEAIMEQSEFNSWLSLQANLSMIALCVMWLVTQSLWFFARKYLEKFSDWTTQPAKA